MSRERIDLASLRQAAHSCHSWAEAANTPQLRSVYPANSPQFRLLDRKLKLTDQALRMLSALNDFDRHKVTAELLDISRYPSQIDANVGRRNVFKRMLRTRYPFKGYHYKILYTLDHSNKVVIDDIYFDSDLLGRNKNPVLERNALYRVNRTGNSRFTKDFVSLGSSTQEITETLQNNWRGTPSPTHRIETQYAAVNGILNPLPKAAWLMGTHLDAAYPKANMSEYTLFHNPSDGVGEDIMECAYDKRYTPARSHNVHHFAAILREAQARGQRTHWVAHSQGAIIFSRAVSLASKQTTGSLDCHSVSLHGAGCNLDNILKACRVAGITIDQVRNNPFDIVPNMAGGNRPISGLAQSLKFLGLVFGSDALASPHTLPYLGLETYIKQLEFTGNHKKAAYARKFRQS